MRAEAHGEPEVGAEGLHEGFEIGDCGAEEGPEEHGLLVEERVCDVELGLRGAWVAGEGGEVERGEDDDGEAETEGEDDLGFHFGGHLELPA